MAAPRSFDSENRDRAVRMYHDRLAQSDDSKLAARRHVGELLGINPANLRNWVEDRHFSRWPPLSADGQDPSAEVAALRKENAELRSARLGGHSHGDRRGTASSAAIVFTHGGVIAQVCRQVTGSTRFAFTDVENGSLTRFTVGIDGRWRLRSFNDTAHLPKAGLAGNR